LQNKKKMSLEDFARINRSTNEGEPMPRQLLESIYASIARDELKISAGGLRYWVGEALTGECTQQAYDRKEGSVAVVQREEVALDARLAAAGLGCCRQPSSSQARARLPPVQSRLPMSCRLCSGISWRWRRGARAVA
jgi:hypothetical protein